MAVLLANVSTMLRGYDGVPDRASQPLRSYVYDAFMVYHLFTGYSPTNSEAEVFGHRPETGWAPIEMEGCCPSAGARRRCGSAPGDTSTSTTPRSAALPGREDPPAVQPPASRSARRGRRLRPLAVAVERGGLLRPEDGAGLALPTLVRRAGAGVMEARGAAAPARGMEAHSAFAPWNRFWFERPSRYGLAAFRILFGSLLVWYVARNAGHVELLYSAEGVTVPYLLPDLAPGVPAALALFAAWLTLAGLFTLGLWTRSSRRCCWGCTSTTMR